MRMPERERRYLEDIRESIERIRGYTSCSLEEFLADPMAGDAVIWRLQTIADAAKTRIGDDLKARHPEIEWHAVYGFRNVAAHNYADVDLDRVWAIVTEDLRPLHEVVGAELNRP